MKTKPTKRYLRCVGEALSHNDLGRVRRYAHRQCQQLERAGVRVDGLAEQLVSDALADTTLQASRWSQTRPLATHLCGLIRGRARAMAVHARRFPTIDAGQVANKTNIESDAIRKDVARKVVSMLRSLAAARNDAVLLRVIDAYTSGTIERRDVAAELGISEREYDSARKRLGRLLARIPPELRIDAKDVIED